MQLADALTLDAPHRTADGYLAVRARAARAGVYDYLASELPGAPDTFKAGDTVKVYRDAAEVFAADSVRSFLGRPITNDHPASPVTAANWRDHARGTIMGAMRDGEHLAFDLVLMDAAAIKAVSDGKRELSNGYACDIEWTPGTAPDGTAYDARQTNIRGNHVAIVDRGRAGPDCAIRDGQKFALCDANPAAVADLKEKNVPKTITHDGLPVSLGDEAAVEALIAKLSDKAATAETALTDANGKVATLTAEKTALEKQLADAKAELEPARIEARVADRAAFVAKAKALKPAVITDGRTDAEIRAELVGDALGDAAKDFTAEQMAAAFAVIAKDAKPAATVTNIAPAATVADAAAKEAEALARANDHNAWRKQA